jgi:hypothetical protein
MKLFDIDCCSWRLRREVRFVPAAPGSGPALCDACRAALALRHLPRDDSHLSHGRDTDGFTAIERKSHGPSLGPLVEPRLPTRE